MRDGTFNKQGVIIGEFLGLWEHHREALKIRDPGEIFCVTASVFLNHHNTETCNEAI